ncbi:MAG: hypothetical protein ACLFTO_00750 [Candidatus Acetothermia bacterium]
MSAGEAGLEIDGSASYFRVNSNDTRLNYEYEINYTYQPFRLLAIPAGLLTVFGVVALYRGFEEFMSNFAERRAKELEKEKSGGHVDFMGIDEEDVESDDEDGYK